MASPDPLRIGIVGANWTLQAHAPAWRMVPGCEVTSICTSRPQTAKEAAEKGQIANAYWDVNEMFARPDIDLVVIGTNPSTRVDIVKAALEAKKHVYSCVPFALDRKGANEQRDAQLRNGVVGVVDAQFRWVPALRYMKDLIQDGWLGDIFQATVELQTPLIAHEGARYPSSAHSGVTKPYPWLAEAGSGASGWRNFGTHSLLNLTWILGEMEEIIGEQKIALKEWTMPGGEVVKPENPDTAMALVKFKNGVFANINTGWSKSDAMTYRFEIWGSKGRFLIEDTQFCDAPRANLFFGEPSKREYGTLAGKLLDIPEHYYEVPGTNFSKANCPIFVQPMVALFNDMAEAIREGRQGSPSFTEAAHVHQAIEAMVESTKSRSWTKV